MEEGDEGHEVRWKRSDLTAGEYTGLQRSHKGIMQPLNTRHVSHCAAHTHIHTLQKKDLSFCLSSSTLIHTHINSTYSTCDGHQPTVFTILIKMTTVGALNRSFFLPATIGYERHRSIEITRITLLSSDRGQHKSFKAQLSLCSEAQSRFVVVKNLINLQEILSTTRQ